MPPELPIWFESDRWVPPPEQAFRVSRFLTQHGLASYRDLIDRAEQDPEWYYSSALEFFSLEFMEPYRTLLDDSAGPEDTNWFVGAKTNVAWLARRRWDDHDICLTWESDDGDERSFTAAELFSEVGRVAAGLTSLGIGVGDVVCMYLPMVPEAVVTMLAVARIGAVVMPAFSGFGTDALLERLRLSEARALVTADGFQRRSTEYVMLTTAKDAARLAGIAPNLQIVVQRLGRDVGGATAWSSLGLDCDEPPVEQPFDVSTPWLLAFTSGSSGRPKGVVHTHGGMPYGGAVELGLCFDIGPGDSLCWPTDMGWLVGSMTSVVSLILGARVHIFEGVMDHPAPNRLWSIVERQHLTHLGLSPTIARVLAQHGVEHVDRHDLSSLRAILSTGEPWTLPAWKWLHRNIGRGRVPIINWTGGTEVGGGILVGSPLVPTPAGWFAGPTPGMTAQVVDDTGTAIIGEPGELVVTRSWPSMTDGLWHDRDRFHSEYWAQYPGKWMQGDKAIEHPDGTWELVGRSDDVFKVAGKRTAPTEFESAAMTVPGVVLAGVIPAPHPVKGQVPVIAITVDADADNLADLPELVSAAIVATLGKPMRPEWVLVVDELPLTRSNKLHRRALRSWLLDTDPGDLSSLANPASEQAVRAAASAVSTPQMD